MSLSVQERQVFLNTIKNTSRDHGAVTFPTECYDFPNLCHIQQVARAVDGHEYTFYITRAKNQTKNCPVHINIHGGGFVIPHMENDTMYSAYIADSIQGIVVDIDYTTSDKAPWPVAFDQCYDAAMYVKEHCAEWGGDAKKISMGGYSAGGVLTAGLALKAAETDDFPLCLQILGYPPLDYLVEPQYKKEGYTRMMPAEREIAFTNLYFDGDPSCYTNPFSSPAYATDEMLAKLPRTLVISASGCNFRFENEDYAERLAALGVEVTVKRFSGANHGFIPHFMPGWQDASDLIIRTIRSASCQ